MVCTYFIRLHDIAIMACEECLVIVHKMDNPLDCACSAEIQTILCIILDN